MVLVILIQSCATTELWKRTDPEEYVQISMQAISESEFKEKGIKYYKDEKERVYYFEKSAARKIRDYSLRLLLTPITVTIDAATAIVVIAVVMYGPISKEACEKDYQCSSNTFER